MAWGNCPYGSIMCLQGCGCCKDCTKANDPENKFSPPECACGIWRSHRNDSKPVDVEYRCFGDDKPVPVLKDTIPIGPPIQQQYKCKNLSNCEHRVRVFSEEGFVWACKLNVVMECGWVGEAFRPLATIYPERAEECKEVTCEGCVVVGLCPHAYSKAVKQSKYAIVAYSKSINWEHKPIDIPTADELEDIIRRCRSGSQLHAKALFEMYRFCKSPTNETEADVITKMYNAFHELFG